jgi:hypothetical protein
MCVVRTSFKEIKMPDTSMADDTLEGAGPIAEYIGKPPRRTQYLLETGRLPAFKLGGKWNMRKSTYRRYIQLLEASAADAAP